jgi:hypothetical protein
MSGAMAAAANSMIGSRGYLRQRGRPRDPLDLPTVIALYLLATFPAIVAQCSPLAGIPLEH